MRTWGSIGLAAGLLAGPAGCGTLFAPGPDPVPVSSSPSGASVFLDGRHSGTTPTVVAVPRDSEGVFTFQLEGYETARVDRNKVANGIAFLNLLGGTVTIPVFFAIDILTGNVGKYSTEPLHVDLVPKEAGKQDGRTQAPKTAA